MLNFLQQDGKWSGPAGKLVYAGEGSRWELYLVQGEESGGVGGVLQVRSAVGSTPACLSCQTGCGYRGRNEGGHELSFSNNQLVN